MKARRHYLLGAGVIGLLIVSAGLYGPGKAVAVLNRNQGAATVLTTIVLAVVTTWYVFLTRGLLLASRSAQRPYVFLDITGQGGAFLDIAIANGGERAATDIRFNFISDLTDSKGDALSVHEPFYGGITYLPPGRRWRYHLDLSPQELGANPDEDVFEVEVSYAYDGSTFKERFRYDLGPMVTMLTSTFSDATEQIARSLKSIESTAKSRDSQDRMRRMMGEMSLCVACRSQIPAAARKCRYCLELQPDSEVDSPSEE